MAKGAITPDGVSYIIATASVFFFATISIVLRFLARTGSRTVGIDDWVSLISYILLAGVSICHFLISGPYGYVPTIEYSPRDLEKFLIVLYADNICYGCCTATVKMSILLLYRRIFVTRVFKIVTAVLAGMLIVWWICILLFQIFSCTPVGAYWILGNAEYCLDLITLYNSLAISNIIWDFTLLLLPLPMVWRLNMMNRRKLQLCGIFLVGIFICICSIMRVITLGQLEETGLTQPTWWVGVWTIIECGVGVSCSCMPPLVQLFKEWHRKATEAPRLM
ncbi:hypothetical protein K449DRAFT_437790 [Hypoxylon sp. EC38]|nr:hypothetical protein K449DRAFT_437790 [Hypoxylon sp. EC38]